jgi:hypothetical protein
MKSTMKKVTCRALVVSLLALSFQTANAGLIGADAAAGGAAPVDRAVVLSYLDRAETVAQLQSQGIDPTAARARVAAMSDQEVQALAQDMQTAPAGATLHAAGWVGVVIVLAAIWYFAFRK